MGCFVPVSKKPSLENVLNVGGKAIAQLYGQPYDHLLSNLKTSVHHKNPVNNSMKTEDILDLVKSVKPVEIEVEGIKHIEKPRHFDDYTPPHGMIITASTTRIIGNPSIPNKVEELTTEKVKAHEAISELIPSYDEYYIQTLLSAGLLGEKKRMVPTRWAITATDEAISSLLIKKIKTYPVVNEFWIYHNHHIHNNFVILLIPQPWGFENFEHWQKKSYWGKREEVISHEFEKHGGRSKYAESQAGGYYASKMAAAHLLTKIRKQAAVMVIREISPKYTHPVGVWQVREAIKHAKLIHKASDKKEVVEVMGKLLHTNIQHYLQRSYFFTQRTLWEY